MVSSTIYHRSHRTVQLVDSERHIFNDTFADQGRASFSQLDSEIRWQPEAGLPLRTATQNRKISPMECATSAGQTAELRTMDGQKNQAMCRCDAGVGLFPSSDKLMPAYSLMVYLVPVSPRRDRQQSSFALVAYCSVIKICAT
jgi:hypothetical protein